LIYIQATAVANGKGQQHGFLHYSVFCGAQNSFYGEFFTRHFYDFTDKHDISKNQGVKIGIFIAFQKT